jgi:hypothetical protein
MSDLHKILHTQYIQDTNPRYPSGSKGWETFLIDRIALLEAVAEAALCVYDAGYASGALEGPLIAAGYLKEQPT